MAEKNSNPSGTVRIHSVPETPITDQVMAHIRVTAWKMTRHSNFGISDFDDICQDLAAAVIRAFDGYDCSRSSYNTYAQTVINRTKNWIYRERIRRGMDRAAVRIDSINPESPALMDENTSSPCESLERRGKSEKIRTIVDGLPNELRMAATMLADGYSLGDITAACGFTSSQYYHRILPALQRIFRENSEFL